MWFNRQYLMKNEVGIMDAPWLTNLNLPLGKITSNLDSDFRRLMFNRAIFAGDIKCSHNIEAHATTCQSAIC